MLARINRSYVPTYWDDFFNDTFFNHVNRSTSHGTSPAVNVAEEDMAYRIEVSVPGLSRKDFRIDLDNDVLTISSEHKENKEDKKKNYLRREFSYQSFKRSFQLPETIDQEKINASHDAGILTIQLPKREELVQKAAKQIEIK